MTLLAYKAFDNRAELIGLNDEDLSQTFNEFIASDLCPYFVKKAYLKANETRDQAPSDGQQPIVQCEVNQEVDFSIEDSDHDVNPDPLSLPHDTNQNLTQEKDNGSFADMINNEGGQRPPLAKFTHDYQEASHMGHGLTIEAENLEEYDDDADLLEEIRHLSHEKDLIFDHTKDKWSHVYPDTNAFIEKAQKLLDDKPELDYSSTTLNPNDLDPTQSFFVHAILDWTRQCIQCILNKNPFPSLKAKLMGVAGTGKSKTIKTLIHEFDKLMANSLLPKNQRGNIKICAPTGVAAFNLGCGAGTIHSSFDINVKGAFSDVTGDRQKRLEESFRNVWLVIIDEISMVGADLFAKINERLIQAKLDENTVLARINNDPSLPKPDFGGLGIIISGDMAQLVPILAQSLMDPSRGDPNKLYHRYSNKGKELFEGFHCTVMLTKQHRQSGGDYAKLCLKFRDGNFTVDDHRLLQSRNFDDLPFEQQELLDTFGTRLVTTNVAAGAHNAKKIISVARQKKQKIFRIQSTETGNKGRSLAASENFSGLKAMVHVTIGSRVMLTNNLWIQAGLINGAQGTVVDISYDENTEVDGLPNYVMVKLDAYGGPPLFQDLQHRNWVPIFPISRKHHSNWKKERTGIPLRLCWAMTGFKVQGLSLYNGIINQYPDKKDPSKRRQKDPMGVWGLNYCMLTRAPDINKVAFINLPDYNRHIKLYKKDPTKEKSHFHMFLSFDRKSFAEFSKFFQFCTGDSIHMLESAEQNFNIVTPIDFDKVSKEDWLDDLPSAPLPQNNPHLATKIYSQKERKRKLMFTENKTKYRKEKGQILSLRFLNSKTVAMTAGSIQFYRCSFML